MSMNFNNFRCWTVKGLEPLDYPSRRSKIIVNSLYNNGRQNRAEKINVTVMLQKGGVPATPSGTATLLRLSPSYQFCPRSLLAVTNFRHPQLPWLDGRCVQGPGTYSPRHGWCAITSESNFTESSCRLRSELRQAFEIRTPSLGSCPLYLPL